MAAEGVPCSSGYTPLNKEGFLKDLLASKAYPIFARRASISPYAGVSGYLSTSHEKAAVVALRKQSASLVDFINRISWMTSFEALQKAVGQ